VQRSGYLAPNSYFVNFLNTRSDPRVDKYFNSSRDDFNPDYIGLSGKGNAPMVFVSAEENLLIGAEAAYKTGDVGKTLLLLNRERALQGRPAYPVTTIGAALLQAILDEKYTITLLNIESWNDYKRTCFPQLSPLNGGVGGVIPGRLLYPVQEQNANPNIPPDNAQPLRNWNDPNPCPAP